MTVVVGFLCQDGIVIAADSMLTPSLGGMNVGHHKGKKVHCLSGGQIYAFAGDQGQAARFQAMADINCGGIAAAQHPLDHPLNLTTGLIGQFTQTGINQSIDVNTLLGFVHSNVPQLCAFEGAMQPRLLDQDHYYVALGSGKLSADPFLRFLVDTFCQAGLPTLSEATLLAIWAVQYVIDTNPGGVAGPIKMAVIETRAPGAYAARELSPREIDDHKQAIESARKALRDWRDSLGGEADGGNVLPPKP